MTKHHFLSKLIVVATLILGAGVGTAPATTLAATTTTTTSATTLTSAFSDTSSYVKKQLATTFASSDNTLDATAEWMLLGYARSGADTTSYAKRYLADAKAKLASGDAFGYGRTTDYSRVAIAITALGGNAADMNGINVFDQLSDFDTTLAQGLNGAIFALIAVDTNSDYQFTATTSGSTATTKQGLVDYILSKEMADGGWNLYGTTSDVDITAMALQALAPFKDQTAVATAIKRGVAVLSTSQNDDGGYTAYGVDSVESVAQVITALAALKIDAKSADFTKNGHSLIDSLLSFHIAGSGFAHTLGGTVNGMATEQSYYALVAYNRYLNGQTTLYDMSDVNATASEPTDKTATTDNTNTDKTGTTNTDSTSKATDETTTKKNQADSTVKQTTPHKTIAATSSSAKKKTAATSRTTAQQSSSTPSTTHNEATRTSSARATSSRRATTTREKASTLPQLGNHPASIFVIAGISLLFILLFIGKKVRFDA